MGVVLHYLLCAGCYIELHVISTNRHSYYNVCACIHRQIYPDSSKSLSDQMLVEYSQHGKHIFTPYQLSYPNQNMIKLLMSSANDAL